MAFCDSHGCSWDVGDFSEDFRNFLKNKFGGFFLCKFFLKIWELYANVLIYCAQDPTSGDNLQDLAFFFKLSHKVNWD